MCTPSVLPSAIKFNFAVCARGGLMGEVRVRWQLRKLVRSQFHSSAARFCERTLKSTLMRLPDSIDLARLHAVQSSTMHSVRDSESVVADIISSYFCAACNIICHFRFIRAISLCVCAPSERVACIMRTPILIGHTTSVPARMMCRTMNIARAPQAKAPHRTTQITTLLRTEPTTYTHSAITRQASPILFAPTE